MRMLSVVLTAVVIVIALTLFFKVDQVLGKVLFIVFPGQDEYKVRDFDRIGAVS